MGGNMVNTVNILYGQLLREDREKQARRDAERGGQRSRRHYPSSPCALVDGALIGKCRRATWYEWNDVPKTNPIDAPALFKMQVGDIIHEHLSATLNRGLAELGFEEEHLQGDGLGEEVATVWAAPGLKYPVSGRMDKRFVRPSDGLRVTTEWKSTYGRGADFIKRDGPKEDNLMQCASYLEQDVFPVDAVVLMYAARDSGYMFGYWVTKHEGVLQVAHMGSTRVEFSPLGWPAVLAGLQSLEAALELPEPPARDYPEKDWRCQYCGHHDECWGKR